MVLLLQASSDAPSSPSPLLGAGIFLIAAVIGLVFYVFFSYCYKRICEKAGVDPGVIIWVPIAQMIPVFQAAGLHPALLLLLLVPFANIVMIFYLVARLCMALGKNPWIAAALIVPLVNIFVIPYLAFSDSSTAAAPAAFA